MSQQAALVVSDGWEGSGPHEPSGTQQSVPAAMNAHANAAGTAPQRLNSRMAKVPRRRNMQVVYRQSFLANKATVSFCLMVMPMMRIRIVR